MTKEITKAFILQQLQDKFGMREFEASKFLFDETVVPVYNIERHLEDWIIKFYTNSITAGSIGRSFFTVPQGERWTLRGYNVVFMTGSYKVTGVYIQRIPEVSGNLVYLDMTLNQTVSYAHNLPVPVVLNPGDHIKIYVDDYTSIGDLRLYIDYMKEALR